MKFKKGDLVRFNCDSKDFGNSTYKVLSTVKRGKDILVFIDRYDTEQGFFEWRFERVRKEEYLYENT